MDRTFSVWKPKGPTSYDIIRALKKVLTKGEKIGHAGTLDPLASGVLVIAVGREATKKLHEAVRAEKEYIAKIRLGAVSTTDDSEGKITEKDAAPLEKRDITEAVHSFKGVISQIPPIYSALKIQGKPAYKLARQGKDVKMKPREAKVFEAEILDYKWPFLDIRFVTGPGVYIRALARDIGEKLGVGGYLADLERTRVGEFTKENSMAPEETAKIIIKD
jgi:tRNA pseudouridine55 synthase